MRPSERQTGSCEPVTTEALQSGISMNRASEVEGYTMQSALQGENVYYPSSYRERLGGSSLQDNANVRVSVAVVGHFNAP